MSSLPFFDRYLKMSTLNWTSVPISHSIQPVQLQKSLYIREPTNYYVNNVIVYKNCVWWSCYSAQCCIQNYTTCSLNQCD